MKKVFSNFGSVYFEIFVQFFSVHFLYIYRISLKFIRPDMTTYCENVL